MWAQKECRACIFSIFSISTSCQGPPTRPRGSPWGPQYMSHSLDSLKASYRKDCIWGVLMGVLTRVYISI